MYSYNLPIRPPADLDECSEKFVAIGIDFGTTYSGVSWARSTHPKEVHAIYGWKSEDHRNRNEVQVPTLYDIASGSWGYEITPDMTPIKWFKLLLLKKEDITKEEIQNSAQLQEARKLLSQATNGMTPVRIVGLYLKNIWEHTYAALRSILDIENLPLRVAITIPAIWPAYAQSAMREAAKIAGIMDYREIGETTLILVQEPEAAALASLFQRNSFPEIQKNESFVVCDAGGGTVDVISYKVVSEEPFKLEEEWELGAKRSFSATSDQPYNLRPPSKAYGTVARLMNKETLSISKDEMMGFFNRSLTGIRTLVGEQYKKVQEATGKPLKKILLVGGLGSSEYIYEVLNNTEMFSNKVLRPSDGWSAVARGAVLRLLQENITSQRIRSPRQQMALRMLPDVVSRRSRYHYGILVNMPISDFTLEPEDKVFTDPEGTKVASRMDWYLKKGDKIDKKSRIPVTYWQFHRARDPLPPKCTFDILYSAEDIAPKRQDSEVLSLCHIECDWDKPLIEWKFVGDPSKGWKKHDDLALTMGLQGEPKWEIRVGSNKKTHDFNIEYIS
ncbi:heat shock 70 kDa 12B [Fusarium heterosporum]|uniref:Heat shock 70 kDa 12B n=1 Tax=Fusarium heterosporum TaxID=42747 RepID=A0A8H5ST23_FUSHE|nr:heat shock 70 kDa 12B [Fusarium heterosporum]